MAPKHVGCLCSSCCNINRMPSESSISGLFLRSRSRCCTSRTTRIFVSSLSGFLWFWSMLSIFPSGNMATANFAEDVVFWYAIHGFWSLHIHIWCSSYSVDPITMSINLKERILSKNTKQAIKKRLVFLCQGSTVELNRVSFRNMSQIFVGSTIKTYSLKMISNKIFLIRDIWTSSRLIALKKRVIVKLSKKTILRRQGWQMKFFAPS